MRLSPCPSPAAPPFTEQGIVGVTDIWIILGSHGYIRALNHFQGAWRDRGLHEGKVPWRRHSPGATPSRSRSPGCGNIHGGRAARLGWAGLLRVLQALLTDTSSWALRGV
ncbi:unnamed protein product [Lampetra planeri]